jgi:hypothetical protein
MSGVSLLEDVRCARTGALLVILPRADDGGVTSNPNRDTEEVAACSVTGGEFRNLLSLRPRYHV